MNLTNLKVAAPISEEVQSLHFAVRKDWPELVAILQKGLEKLPNIAILHHALGLWYVRNKENVKAISELKKSVELDKDNARFSYVYAVSVGEKNPKEAIKILEEIYPKHTGDLQIVSALVYYTKAIGDMDKSKMYDEKFKKLQNFSVR